LFPNTTGNPVIVEFVGGAQTTGFVDGVELNFSFERANGQTFLDFAANPVNLPLSFDPGVRIPSGGKVECFISNNTASSVPYELDLIGRELV